MKNVNLQIEVEIKPEVIWRLKLFMAIMRFAVWVGGFGGVDFDIPECQPTQHASAAASPLPPACSHHTYKEVFEAYDEIRAVPFTDAEEPVACNCGDESRDV